MPGPPSPADDGDMRDLQPVDIPMDRRAFLVWAAGASVGATGVFIGATALQALVPPQRSIDGRTNPGRVVVARLAGLTTDKPAIVEYGGERIFIVKRSGTEALAFSVACPHVGCTLAFNRTAREFQCPCHGSAFTIEGALLRGPARRNMTRADCEVVDGEVIVSGFRV